MKPWGVCNIPTLLLLPGQSGPGLVEPDSVLSIGQIEMFDI